MALVGALTPLGKVARNYWLKSVIAFTLAGCTSAVLVGGLLGLLGRVLQTTVGFRSVLSFQSLTAVALVVMARELGWINFPLPEQKRQTDKVWAHEFGFVTASAMWGFHIGSGFSTYLTNGGGLLLVCVALAVGKPTLTALLMATYWLGRATPVWLLATIWPNQHSTHLVEAIAITRPTYKHSAGVASLWLTIAAARCALQAGHIWTLPALRMIQ